jgi:hypothetical protein
MGSSYRALYIQLSAGADFDALFCPDVEHPTVRTLPRRLSGTVIVLIKGTVPQYSHESDYPQHLSIQ